MQYRRFGKLDWKGSALGFGAMRLPKLGQEFTSPIDEPLAINMIRFAIDNGVNYVDTAFPYGMGGSERLVGKALQDGYREKVKLATKLSHSFMKSPDEFDRYLNAQLKRLQADKIDCYLLHGLNKSSWNKLKDWKVFDFLERKVAEGKIGNLGFSFHDQYETFKDIVDYYDNWTFCQVQYNYLDENNQAGRKGVEYAAGKGLAVVIMEPLRGGQLAKTPPPVVAEVWNKEGGERDRIEWALDWVWDQEEVSLVLSGMSTMEQVQQNVEYASRSGIGMLSPDQEEIFPKIIDAYKTLSAVPCTGCLYCQPCPNNVDIPGIFAMYNDVIIFEDRRGTIRYTSPMGMAVEQRANNCVECGECVEKCPQQIDIPKELKKAHEELIKDVPVRPRRDGVSYEE